MAEQMPIAEAADVVRVLARQRVREAQSFERIEEALETAMTVETAIARLIKEKSELAEDVEALRQSASDLGDAAREAREHSDQEIAHAKADAEAQREGLRRELKALEGHLEDVRKTIAREAAEAQATAALRAATAQQTLDAITAGHRLTLGDVRAQLAEAQEALAATRQQFADLLAGAAKAAQGA